MGWVVAHGAGRCKHEGAQSRCECGRGELSPGSDVAGLDKSGAECCGIHGAGLQRHGRERASFFSSSTSSFASIFWCPVASNGRFINPMVWHGNSQSLATMHHVPCPMQPTSDTGASRAKARHSRRRVWQRRAGMRANFVVLFLELCQLFQRILLRARATRSIFRRAATFLLRKAGVCRRDNTFAFL